MINHPPGHQRPKATDWPTWENKARVVVAVVYLAADALPVLSDKVGLYRWVEKACRDAADRIEGR